MHKCKNTSHEAPRLRVAANLADELAASLAIRYNNHPNSDRTARRGRASTPQQNAGQPYSAPTPPQSSRTGELPNHEHPGPSQCTPRRDGISAAQPIQRTEEEILNRRLLIFDAIFLLLFCAALLQTATNFTFALLGQ